MLHRGVRRGGRARRLALVFFCGGLGLSPALPATAIDVPRQSATLAWAPTSGPVAGYAVFVSRNGEPFPANAEKFTLPDSPKVTLSGGFGESLAIRVAAYDALGNVGPVSPTSEPIRFVDPLSGGGTPSGPPPRPPADVEPDSNDLIHHACGEVPVLTGIEKLKVEHLPREDTQVVLTLAYCDGYWASTDGQGLTLSGTYEAVANKPNKLRFFLDEISDRELMAALGVRATLKLGYEVITDVEKAPRFRLKRKAKDGVTRLKGKLNLLDVGYGDLGIYKIKASSAK